MTLLTWQELGRNEWLSALREALAAGRTLPAPRVGVPGAFGLADAGAVRRFLAAAGFQEIGFEDVSERMYLGADTADALGFVLTLAPTQGLLAGLDAGARAGALESLRTMLAAHETGKGVLLDSRAWLITARCP